MDATLETVKPIIAILGGVLALILFWRWRDRSIQKKSRVDMSNLYPFCMSLFLNDVYLPLPDGTTSKIDIIIVSKHGIFVVEKMTYSGSISADENSPEWTQTIDQKESRFQNPMRENYRHICALADKLGIDKSCFHGVVAFNDEECTFKTDMPEGVVYSRDLFDYFNSFRQPLIKHDQINDLADVISEWQVPPRKG